MLLMSYQIPTQKGVRLSGVPQLKARWGVSGMFVERRIKNDPNFPAPRRFTNSKIRKWTEAEIQEYERITITKVARQEAQEEEEADGDGDEGGAAADAVSE
jgi:hypothetical protein